MTEKTRLGWGWGLIVAETVFVRHAETLGLKLVIIVLRNSLKFCPSERTFNNTSPKVKEQLKVLWKSPGYTPHAIANHPRVPEDVVKSIQAAMLAMSQDP